MLVHIVTAANRSLYSEYIEKMFVQRKHVFVDWLKWEKMHIVEGKERDELDDLPDVEYILTIGEFGDLLGSARFAPTTGPHLMAGPLAHFAEKPYECGPDTWELTRLAPIATRDTPLVLACRAMMSTGIMEWALRRGVKRLLGIPEDKRIHASSRMGWRTEVLSEIKEYQEGRFAAGVSYYVEREALCSTRQHWQLSRPVTYEAPPPLNDEPITAGEIQFLDAIHNLDADERDFASLEAMRETRAA